MKTHQRPTAIICVVLVMMQVLYIAAPVGALPLHNLVLRPLIFAVLAVVLLAGGRDVRPVRHAYESKMVAVLTVAAFGIIIIALALVFGAGTNMMTANAPLVLRNLWGHGFVVLAGAVIRYKLIKATPLQGRTAVVVAVTLVLGFSHMGGIRMLLGWDVIVWVAFFESVFQPLVISAVASYFAVKGAFASVLVVSSLFTMTPYLLPVLPDIPTMVFIMLSCGVAFVSAVMLRFVTHDENRLQRTQQKRALKYAPKTISDYVMTVGTAVVLVLLVAFFAGAFRFYPVVVLTGSMAGTFERGSLVFVERLPPGEAYYRVGEGYVIHFAGQAGADFIHRVVDFRHGEDGRREYITRGDAGALVDPHPVVQEDVLGIARASMPFLGYPYIFFRAVRGAFRSVAGV